MNVYSSLLGNSQRSNRLAIWLLRCDRPNLLQFSVDAMVSFSPFGRVTGLLARPILLACYELFFVSGQKTTALFCLHSVWMTGRGQGHPEASL
jgi:hypothetical protein